MEFWWSIGVLLSVAGIGGGLGWAAPAVRCGEREHTDAALRIGEE